MRELLEKYWNCETSPEEEQKLREWFAGNDVPEDLQKYRNNFLALNNFQKIEAPASVSRKVLAHLPSIRIYPVLKIAASILVILSIGTGVYTHYQQEEFLKEVFSETYSDPQDAIKETQAVLGKVSSSLLKVEELQEELIEQEENLTEQESDSVELENNSVEPEENIKIEELIIEEE